MQANQLVSLFEVPAKVGNNPHLREEDKLTVLTEIYRKLPKVQLKSTFPDTFSVLAATFEAAIQAHTPKPTTKETKSDAKRGRGKRKPSEGDTSGA